MRLLVVVAHPDDESFGCGSVLARAAAGGHHTVVLCATRGEAGESRLPGIGGAELGEVRETELREAARILGVAEVRLLGHADSGMSGDAAAGTLVAAAATVAGLAGVAAEVRAVIDEVCPDVVVTLDASDGHRDHEAMRDATLLAVDSAPSPPTATYLWCLARSSMARWAEHVQPAAYTGDLGTPDEEITAVVDVAEHVPTRWEAIRAHTSQASPYDDLPEELQEEFLAVDRLRLVRGQHHPAMTG